MERVKKTTLPGSAELCLPTIVLLLFRFSIQFQVVSRTVLMLCQMHSCSKDAFVLGAVYTVL